MSMKRRFVATYRSLVPGEPNEMTFGVRAKSLNKAMELTEMYIYAKELHNHREVEYVLLVEPSNEPATHEIPSDDYESTPVVDDDRYNME